MTFSESVRVAIKTVDDLIYGKLPALVQEAAHLEETRFVNQPLVEISEVEGIKETDTHFWRLLNFDFGHERDWVSVNLEKQKKPDATWEVKEIGYWRWVPYESASEGFCVWRKRYALILDEPAKSYLHEH
jgi:hypothetical protein